MRCPRANQAGHLVETAPPEYQQPNSVVCTEHHSKIEAGEPYRFVGEDSSVLMGDDIRLAGLLMLTAFEGIGSSRGMPPSAIQFRFTDEFGESLTFLTGGEVFNHLAALFSSLDKRPEHGPGEGQPADDG